MILYVYPTLFALFVWWFSTGLIIYLDGLPRSTFRWTLAGASGLLLLSLWGIGVTRDDTSITGAYIAFTCSMLVWAWLEVTYYLGFVTGYRKAICPPDCSGWKHFVHAVETNICHETLTLLLFGLMLALSWGHESQIALWTFLVMWLMTLSAKLNVFFGVRNLNEEFLPEHLWFLKSFFRKRPMNVFLPFSVTLSTVFWIMMMQQASAAAASPFTTISMMLVGAQMALAILEHWLLVLPLPANLWGWSLEARKQAQTSAEAAVQPDVAL